MQTRRSFLFESGGGLGGIALASMLVSEGKLSANDDASKRSSNGLHHPAKATRVVQFFMSGAASHIDLYDYKPELVKRHGQASDFGETVEAFQNGLGPWLKPIWDFKPYGQTGKMLSDVVAPLGSVVDEIAFVHNMVSKSGVHSAAIDWIFASRFSWGRLLGQLRARFDQREPAEFCCVARSSRLWFQRCQELGRRVFACAACWNDYLSREA
jgi:hypothetical protein